MERRFLVKLLFGSILPIKYKKNNFRFLLFKARSNNKGVYIEHIEQNALEEFINNNWSRVDLTIQENNDVIYKILPCPPEMSKKDYKGCLKVQILDNIRLGNLVCAENIINRKYILSCIKD